MMGSRRISKKSFEHYCELMGLSDQQRESAKAMFEGYQSACGAANTEHRAEIEKLNKQAQEEEDHSIFMEKMPEIMGKHQTKTRKLDDDFLADLKLVGSADTTADARWERVERARRRDSLLRLAAMSGEGIDLAEVVRDFKLAEAELAAVQGELLEYEAELDKHLVAKESMMDRQDKEAVKPANGEFDIAKMQERMAEMREVGAKIKETNEKHARKVADLLPEDRRAPFAKLVRARSFPRVYKDSKVARDMSAAMNLPDLTANQRESLAALKASYERDVSPINEAWASAIEAKEKDGQSGMIAAGGAMMMMDFGDEPEAIATAKKSKKDLDKNTRERFDQILTPEQKEKLPKEPAEGEDGVPVMRQGGSLMIAPGR
ncbi:MAG: hypothetical protein ACOYN0_02170, partial [Phycisphaerales bacterium]